MDGMKATAFLDRCLHFKATGLFTIVVLLETLCCTSLYFKVQKKHLTILP